MQTILTFFA